MSDRDPVFFVVGPKRPRGRPRVEEPRGAVMTWLPASDHDRLCRLALRHGLSVSSMLRVLVRHATRRQFPYSNK